MAALTDGWLGKHENAAASARPVSRLASLRPPGTVVYIHTGMHVYSVYSGMPCVYLVRESDKGAARTGFGSAHAFPHLPPPNLQDTRLKARFAFARS